MKRIIDIVGAVTGCLLLWPVVILAAVSVRLSMGSPVLLRQSRIGYLEKPFEIVKFRTMREASFSGEPEAARITRVGRLLRRSSVDELPQLWNVLRGEMSLVGPRPLLETYLGRFSATQRRRHSVLPGITGLAQVKGRNETTWENRLSLDVWYSDHRTLKLDFEILALTILEVFRSRVSASPGNEIMDEFRGNGSPSQS